MKRVGGIQGMRKGPWTTEEDKVLLEHVRNNGARNWSLISFLGLLPRIGKSCRLRWVNKLRPGLKKGRKFTPEEEQRILNLQSQFGNRWATIAKYFPGRTDNDVKNFWSIHRKRLARAQHGPQQAPLVGNPNHGIKIEPKEEVTVATLEKLHAAEEEAHGSNSKGNSSSAASSDVLDPPVVDVNQTWSNRASDHELPQPPPFDSIFDLPPLPEMHLLQPAPGSANFVQGQSSQLTQFPKPEVASMDIGPTQRVEAIPELSPEFIKWEHIFPDSGLGPYTDSVPFFSPLQADFDDLGYMLDSFEPPPDKSPR